MYKIGETAISSKFVKRQSCNLLREMLHFVVINNTRVAIMLSTLLL